jgi:hypothetical protein
MAIMWRRTMAMVAAAGAMAGCLLKEEHHTWYLETTGEVAWSVVEQDVRSDARADADRLREESEYWHDVQMQNHQVARAFRDLGAGSTRTRVIRSAVPFAVVTDANFTSIDSLARQLILLSGLDGTSTLEQDGDAYIWTMTVRDPRAGETRASSEDVLGLTGALESLRVVLVRGRFESAAGFRVEADRRIAVFDAEEDGDTVTMVWQLRWLPE